MPRRVMVAAVAFLVCVQAASAGGRVVKPGSVSPLLGLATDRGRAPRTDRHRIVVGLALRNRDQLEAFLADVQDPASPRYGRFMTQDEFDALHAPTAADEEAIVSYLGRSGLHVTDRFRNRLVVSATGSVEAIERAFGVEIHAVQYRGRPHFAAIDEPLFPAELADAVLGVVGLDDLVERRPRLRTVVAGASLGTNCCALAPADLAAFYETASGFDGSGETIVIAGAYAWKDTDNTGFSTQWSLPQLPAGSGQVCTGSSHASGCKFSNQNSIEVALDAEYAHAAAPGARIINYMAASTTLADFTIAYNRIVTDNPGHVVTTSWGACEAGVAPATQQTDDGIFANANAIGQSWFAASGDNGSLDCNGILTVDNPANSPHVIGVGGTTPVCSGGMTSGSPACVGYGSETGWSGSGGGVSQIFARPSFQTGCGVSGGSQRLVPDVALESDPSPGNYVLKGGFWYVVAGTSGAAPQWAGYFAQLDQKAGGTGLGNPGALLYGLCSTAAFHDIVSGSNGDYAAAAGYDMVTGLGSPRVSTLVALGVPGGSTTTSTTTTAPTTTTSSTTSTTTFSTTTTAPPTTSTSTTSTTTSAPPTTTTSTTTSSTTTAAPTTTTSSTTSTTSTSSTTTSTTSTTTSSTTTTAAPTTSTSTTSTTTSAPPTTTTSTTTSSTTTAAPTTTTSSTTSTTSTSSTTSSTTSTTTSSTATTAAPTTSTSTTSTTTSAPPPPTTSTTTSPTTTTAPTTTTSLTTSTTTTSSTTTTAAPTTSTTTTSTTTSTLPLCPADGFPGLRCVLAPGLGRAECAHDVPPQRLRRRFARVVRLLDEADDARPKRARRLAARMARVLRRSVANVDRMAKGGLLGADCPAALRTMLDDGRARAERLAASP